MKRTAFLFLILILSLTLWSQKRIVNYSFEFEKSFLARGDYDAYFLGYPTDSSFALIMKDNKKTEYVLLNKNFKVVTKLSAAIEGSVFTEGLNDYTGGTTNGKRFHFIYNGRSGNYLETVDFETKAISHRKIFEESKAEKPLVSFSDYNRYYAITANDKTSELIFYTVDSTGELVQNSIAFPIPPTADKKKNKLSQYLAGIKLIKSSEEPDLSTAVTHTKLISYPDRLQFIVNDDDNPTHIVTVSLPHFNLSEKRMDYTGVLAAGGKAKLYISSFEKDNKLYSLLLNKREIRVVVHDLTTGSLLNQYAINEETSSNLFAMQPVSERRLGKKTDEKEVDIKKLIKAFTKGSEGLMVSENKAGQLIVTVGTYDFIPLSSGGGGGWVGGWQQTSMPTTPSITNHGATVTAVSRWNPTMYYRPGSPVYTTMSARYYTTTYFKLLLDPVSFKTTRGRVPTSTADQIKDYIEGIGSKVKATNQFSVGQEQYYGYYDKDAKSYVIDQIRIIQ